MDEYENYRWLAFAIVMQAIKDARQKASSKLALEAREWLASEDCMNYCLLLNINFDQIQRWLSGL